MNTIEYAKNKLTSLGWQVKSIEYNKPSSGFKCIEGGFFCEIETDEDDYDLLKAIPFDDKIFGTIHGAGQIMALYKNDFLALINKIPKKQIKL